MWSNAMARALLAPLSDGEIASTWGADSGEPGRLRDELSAWARDDADVRRWMAAAWQGHNETLVDEVESYAPEELAPRAAALCDRFGVDAVLLAFLTDEAAHGTDLADAFIEHVTSPRLRQALSHALRRLRCEPDEAVGACKRIVVFGGRPRDAANLDEPLSDLGSFEFRWETFERTGAGGAADTRSITTALAAADAAIIVIGMASHALASLVKAQAQASGIPCRAILRATRRQLAESLGSLFPDRVSSGP